MRRQVLTSLWVCLVLVAGSMGALRFAPTAYAQSGQGLLAPEDFGAWTVGCTRETIYGYVFCNTFHAMTLSDGAGDFAHFGVTRTVGSERVGLYVNSGFAPGSKIEISVDKSHSWTFDGTGNLALLASAAQSKKIVDELLAGKTLHLKFIPSGSAQQEIEVSLATFPNALKRAREQAK
ncbi:MAG TPA: invasion associated locus B family protein [Bradyrhizobium sp.]|nr:invasion associated locus B family protein [Bradyrhizobium sp.]